MNDKLFFEEERHLYWLDKPNDGLLLTSATTFIEKFKQKYDGHFWSLYKGLQTLMGYTEENKKEFSKYLIKSHGFNFKNEEHKTEFKLKSIVDNIGLDWNSLLVNQANTKSEWKTKNTRSLNKGNILHKLKEDKHYEDGGFEFEGEFIKTFSELNKLAEDLKNLAAHIPIVYPELKMFNRQYALAGTTDQVIVYPDKTFSINDWKGLALDTPIATKYGWKTMQDIERGDIIFDGNGELTSVKNVSEIHHNPCYRITFDTHDELVCDHEHKWMITVVEDKKIIEKEFTTDDLYEEFLKEEVLLRIKCVGLTLPDIELPIDPYVLGCWLADGNRTASTISQQNNKVWEEIEKRGYKLGEDVTKGSGTPTRTVYGIAAKLRDLNVHKNKHIPIIYLRSSFNQRLDLLRGFMDGDAHFNRTRKRCSMQTTKKWQSDAFVELTSSLGLKPIVFKCKGTGFGKTIEKYDVCFNSPFNPFLSRNEDYDEAMKDVNFFRSKFRYIHLIEKIDTVPTKCLEVESDTHCYLAGKTLIKTHNTNIEIKVDNKFDKMKYPVNHLPDANMYHYFLQVSLYAWMLEQFGYKARVLKFTWFDIKTDDEGNIIEILDEREYKTHYMKTEIENMLRIYANSNTKI